MITNMLSYYHKGEQYVSNKFIILSQFVKRTQKTPKREIEKAKSYLENYKKRRGKSDE